MIQILISHADAQICSGELYSQRETSPCPGQPCERAGQRVGHRRVHRLCQAARSRSHTGAGPIT
jgi:hypothetical protein